MLRLATAAILGPLCWMLVKLASPAVFLVVAAAWIAGVCAECYELLGRHGLRPFKWLGIGAAILLVGAFSELLPGLHPELVLVTLAVAAWIAAMIWREAPSGMLAGAGSTIAPVASVALMLAYLVALRELPGDDGSDLLLLVVICVIFGDTGAYYVGRWLGRRALAPLLSPRKTWEGLCGGLVASVGGALLGHLWFYQRLPLIHAVVLGLILGLSGVLGDLAESAFKRAVDVKDSSTLLPGHGGLLDRSDSFLFAGPLLYYYYQLLLRP